MPPARRGGRRYELRDASRRRPQNVVLKLGSGKYLSPLRFSCGPFKASEPCTSGAIVLAEDRNPPAAPTL